MIRRNISAGIMILFIAVPTVVGQRMGAITEGRITNRVLISNGPKGPVMGGESAVTDMVLMPDGWVYGSTKATWGAASCHLFRTDGDSLAHLLNLTGAMGGQTAVNDLSAGKGNRLYGCTSTGNEVLDDPSKEYPGGHLFCYDPMDRQLTDLGIVSPGQGIHCIEVDTIRERIFGITYPAGKLFAFDIKTGGIKDYGVIMKPWRVEDMGKVSWRGVPKILIIDDAGTLYFSTYFSREIGVSRQELMKGGSSSYSTFAGGLIFRLANGDEKPVYTGVSVPTQKGMDSDPLYENGIASAIRAHDGGFWCGTINDGFLFKFHPSTSTVINRGKAFQYWNLKSLAWGGDGKLYMLGGRDEDNSWILRLDPGTGSMDCLGWPENTAQCGVICADRQGRILIAENLRHSFIYVYEPWAIRRSGRTGRNESH